MSHRAWAYVLGVILAGAGLAGLALPGLAPSTAQWLTFTILTVLATLAQLFKAQAPNHQVYHATMVFLFAGLLLLHPFLFTLLVLTSHLVEWAKERWVNSAHLRHWYLQPFNIAVHIIAGSIAHDVYTALSVYTGIMTSAILAVIAAVLAYVIANHFLVGLALVLARGVSWRESGVLDVENVLTDFIMLSLGAIVAIVWKQDPWMILLALSPLVLIYRALLIPQLKQEARVDGKTGLWNARHFLELYTNELNRARRFQRPLTFIMADLDLLRNINNTYGHLAGDAVLAGIGRIIRENVRAYDIAGRFGGEEFALVLPETELLEARSIAERLRQLIEAAEFEVNTSPTPIRATMSLGIAAFPTDATGLDDLVHVADVAVYQAKLQGRNRVICAADVPHYIKLEDAPAERLKAPYAAAFAPRPKVGTIGTGSEAETAAAGPADNTPAGSTPAEAETPVPPVQGDAPAGSIPTPKDYPQIWLRPFVGGVIAAGTVATLLGFALSPRSDWVAIGLLTVLAVIAELFQLDLYGDSSVSVSVAIAFAAALLAGLPGVASVSAAIALAHYFRRRPPLYRTAFNWATHVLAGAVPALTTSALALPLHMPTLFLLAVPAAAGLAYYAIETGLIAIAISLSQGASPLHKWRYQYQWLVYHYLVLCTLGLFLTVAYTALGPRGILVFVLPVLMMRHAQKQYIERTSHSMQELTRMNLELTRANHEVVAASQAIGQLNDELFLTLAKIIDARDPYVSGHAAQVATYATTIALELELPADRVEQVRQAAFLHDIGKIGVPEKILHKPARLTDEEYEQVKTHVTLGAGFLETSQGLRHLAPFVRHHHERWDGRGYPDGLCEEQIPMEARILAVCDAVEAMASDRPYHAAMSPADIVAEVRRCAGTQFDPTVAEAFARIVEHKGDQFIVNSAHAVAQKAADDGNLMHQQNGWFRPLESPQTSPIWTPEHAKIT